MLEAKRYRKRQSNEYPSHFKQEPHNLIIAIKE